jgi:hypothetical protein
VSATILSASETLSRIAPALLERDVQFKGPATLEEVKRINRGAPYGYSQIGKIITIYPRSSDEAVTLARLLSEATKSLTAPAVPFEERFGLTGCVYYRYGSYRPLKLQTPHGAKIPAIKTPDGQLIADDRKAADAPDWTNNPFPRLTPSLGQGASPSPLASSYRAFRALIQRGKGGVYQALDIKAKPMRVCLLKEGRAAGEMSWDGRDGAWRVRNEKLVIESLRTSGVNAPEVYDSFEDETNYYLVTEFIDGRTLQESLVKRQRRMSVSQCLRLGLKIANLIGDIHRAGWVWRDCKPSNIIITKDGSLRPIDFEGACRIDGPDKQPWGTLGFTPLWQPALESRIPEDLYALGAAIYFLFTGRLLIEQPIAPVHTMRTKVPKEACQIVELLLTADTSQQPAPSDVAKRLTACLSQ